MAWRNAVSMAGNCAGPTPLRFSPVSTLTVTVAVRPVRRTACNSSSSWRSEDTATCTSASSAGPKSMPGGCSQASTGAVMPSARSASASSTVATPSSAAPAPRAVWATRVAP
ncbi:Uncharacterised protein [Mycobacterium tuberculosis]|nr:Uncharacterised protein [Mycobacterium tuberculosis]